MHKRIIQEVQLHKMNRIKCGVRIVSKLNDPELFNSPSGTSVVL